MVKILKSPFQNFFNKFGTRHNKIFIIPSRYGLYFIAIVFILFLISLSYGHSLAFTTTFVFVALVMTSAHFTNYNLAGVEVVATYSPEEVYAGDKLPFRVTVRNDTKKHRFDLFIKVSELGESEAFSLGPGETKTISLMVNSLERGEYLLKRLVIATSFPFGLFYAWKYWYQDQSFVVYPVPTEKIENLPTPIANPQQRGEHEGTPELGAEEFYGHTNYDVGMPLRSIDWKAYARGKGLLLKKFIEESDVIYLLKKQDHEEGVSALEKELTLNKMTRLIEQVESSGASYGLVLEKESPKYGKGRAFKRECLKRLATFEKKRQVLL